eukprot:m.1655 g.1655  ORF g.1655 m.1655 type:complete len:99 (+) comp7625_c0_seq1:544-840(+)
MSDEFVPPRCLDFMKEWRKCASSTFQFHHYYIHGEFQPCRVHKQNLKNCLKWRITKSEDSLKSLQENMQRQKDKAEKRRTAVNSVWETRTSPPENWNS